jgi:hypothetical protein
MNMGKCLITVGGGILCVEVEDAAPDPSPLLQSSDFGAANYLGAFKLPLGTHGASDFEYCGNAITYNVANNSLFITGHDQTPRTIAEISIPALGTGNYASLNAASVLQNFVDYNSLNVPDYTLTDTVLIGGMLIVDGTLIGTMYEFYDGEGDAVDSHFKLSSLDLDTASVTGLFQVGTKGGGWVGGPMCEVPAEWRAALGTRYICGNYALSIIGRTSRGPAAFGFDPADLGAVAAPTVDLLYYDGTHPLADFDTQGTLYNAGTQIKGVAFPDGTNSVLFLGRQGTGPVYYGTGTSNIALHGTPVGDGSTYYYDPADGSKGYHIYPYRYQVWRYDANDLAAVKAGTMQPWEPQPDVWELVLPYTVEGFARLGGAAWDVANRKLYVVQKYISGGYPVIHVFEMPTL